MVPGPYSPVKFGERGNLTLFNRLLNLVKRRRSISIVAIIIGDHRTAISGPTQLSLVGFDQTMLNLTLRKTPQEPQKALSYWYQRKTVKAASSCLFLARNLLGTGPAIASRELLHECAEQRGRNDQLEPTFYRSITRWRPASVTRSLTLHDLSSPVSRTPL